MSSNESAASQEAAVACEAPPASLPPAASELRIVLVGRTGAGRSSSGNTILGRSAFWADASPCSVTSECLRRSGTLAGRGVSVVDTPGFLHTRLPPHQLLAEVGRCVALCSPGPHVFLVTLRPGRFTQEERDALKWIRATFGPGAARFTLALFTCGDQLHGKSMEDFLEESEDLTEFVAGCQGGYHVLDNSVGKDETTECSQQVAALLEKIDKVVAGNGGSCYSDEMFQEAERAIRDAQERILEETGHAGAEADDKDKPGPESERSRSGSREDDARMRSEEEEARKRAERVFWSELVTALGKGAAEGAGIVGKDKGKGKVVKKSRVVALATTPLSVSSAAKAVGGAVREGTKVLYKHRKTFLR